MAVVSILAIGSVDYALAAREAVLSALHHSDFPIVVTCDRSTRHLVPDHSRVTTHLVDFTRLDQREDLFLAKFAAWDAALTLFPSSLMLHLDADAVLTRPLAEADLDQGLGDAGIGMAEQSRTLGASPMARSDLFSHYVDHTLRHLAPEREAPPLETFRSFNSGVVLFRPEALATFLVWASSVRQRLHKAPSSPRTMLADQDYLQVWGNVIDPGSVTTLPWEWNHCPLWDEQFPDPGARIVHLSNFCEGPTPETRDHLSLLRGGDAACPSPRHGDLTFVVVSHHSAALLRTALDAASRLGHVIVVDNASEDASREIALRAGASLVANAANLGFAIAANQGAAAASTRWICFLNPDCFVRASAVDMAVAALADDPQQIVVPILVDWHGHRASGRQWGYTRTKLAADLMETAELHRVSRMLRSAPWIDDRSWAWPLGTCLFVERDTFQALGGFDESYFCYMEDVELGLRAARAQVAIRLLDTEVLHLGQKGTSLDEPARRDLLEHARRQYGLTHYGALFVHGLRLVRRLAHQVDRTLHGLKSLSRGEAR
ncbi:glycosyltransferase [Phreatobacter sp.]|uniref:glycosyltransferase n=1 Tax=Phreatobacter sp. TaxID=1966341 RepID=UPI0022C5DDCC|nr:glycosyltransferase [Phreatobacter sp.]MCZ8315513.1 glycosyltransferase [Phreatobacter sp.]